MDRIEAALRSIDETLKDVSEALKAFAPVALDKPDYADHCRSDDR